MNYRLFLPRTQSIALALVIAIIAATLTLSSIISIVTPFERYGTDTYYYYKVYWRELVSPIFTILFSVSLWLLRRWARYLLLAILWFIVILVPPLTIMDPDNKEPRWDDSATLISNLLLSNVAHMYMAVALLLLLIHVLQLNKNDFVRWI